MGQGMHTDMPSDLLGGANVERYRRAWWTAYVLDREMTSLVGLPQSIHEDDIGPTLPSFPSSTNQGAALVLRVRLCRAITKINRSTNPMFSSMQSSHADEENP